MSDDDLKRDLFWDSIERLGQRGCESAAKLAEAVQPSHNKQMATALLKVSLQCSNYDDGVRYCDFCGHCINHKEFSANDHIDDCPLKVLGERLNG